MSGKTNQVVASQQKKNLNDLESFCYYCKVKYPCDKPLTKVDASILLLLLNDKMTAEKAEYFRSQISRASGREYKSDGMISILSETLVNVFVSALRPEETDNGPKLKMKTLKTYLNQILEDQKELEEEIIKIKEEKGFISFKEHQDEVQDIHDEYREKMRNLKDDLDKAHRDIEFLREKQKYDNNRYEERIKHLHDTKFNGNDNNDNQ